MPTASRRMCVVLSLAVSAFAIGCPDEPLPLLPPDASDTDSGVDNDAGEAPVNCVEAEAGERCGNNRFCIAHMCMFNICGDGVVLGDEACDDGNQNLGDDCTPSCRWLLGECGDGKRGPLEACDDGNRDDTDACNNECIARADEDAGVIDPLTSACPVIESFVLTPYVGGDTRLVGNYYSVDASFAVAPAYFMWSATGGQVFTTRDRPLHIGFQCGEPGPQTLSLFTAQDNCIAVSHEFSIVCGGTNP